MTNVIVVGMQWGDEGKGKVVDLLCPAFDAVARFQGGHNAGHTVRFGDEHFALHLIPSGVLRPEMSCYLGNGMVIHPESLLAEIDGLEKAGIDVTDRLFVSHRAQIILPAHALLDQSREAALGDGRIGTTSRGIGPAYESKVARVGIRLDDLDRDHLEEQVNAQLRRIEPELRGLGVDPSSLFDETMAGLRAASPRLLALRADVSRLLNEAIDRGESIFFEGAQGALLDVDHGTYPFVTSSNATAGGACIGTGVGPTRIGGAVGILKAYTTRVGEGPFPTELEDATGEHLRERGNEFGTTTGRPRRCGWLDLVLVRYAQQINAIDSIALTKLDVLDALETIQVCTAYRVDGELTYELPASGLALGAIEPVYEAIPGWQCDTSTTLSRSQLPKEARHYLDFIEQRIGASIEIISTGPRREETIVEGKYLDRWLGKRRHLALP